MSAHAKAQASRSVAQAGLAAGGVDDAGGFFAVGEAVAVVVASVGTIFGAEAGRLQGAVRVNAVNESVCIVVDAVGAVFGGQTAGVQETVAVVAVKGPIAVIVDAVGAVLGSDGAEGRRRTGRICAVCGTISVVIDAVVADFGRHHARFAHSARRVIAISAAIPVIVDVIVADFAHSAGKVGRAVGVGAITKSVAVVVDAICTATDFRGRDIDGRDVQRETPGCRPKSVNEDDEDAEEDSSVKPVCSVPISDLIRLCWKSDPATRPTFNEILEVLFQERTYFARADEINVVEDEEEADEMATFAEQKQ